MVAKVIFSWLRGIDSVVPTRAPPSMPIPQPSQRSTSTTMFDLPTTSSPPDAACRADPAWFDRTMTPRSAQALSDFPSRRAGPRQAARQRAAQPCPEHRKLATRLFWWEGKFLMPWESHWMPWLVHKWVSREVDEEKSCQMYLTGQITIGQNKFTLTTTDFVAPPCHAPPNSSQHVSTLYPYLTGKMTPYEITTPPGDFIMKRTYRQKWYIFFWKRAHQMVYFANVQRFLQRRKKLSTPGKIYYVPVLYPLAYK